LRTRELTPTPQAADSSYYVDRLVDTPRQRLKQWDVAEEELRKLEDTRRIAEAVAFRSPIDGVVVASTVLRGMHFQSGQTLYRLADLSVVVIEAEFRESEAPQVREGAPVAIGFDALPGERFSGVIQSLHPTLDEASRTVKARIELPNPKRLLKPGMLANVELSATRQSGIVIPVDAVVDSGSRQIVFVSEGDGYFEPRAVTVGPRNSSHILVLEGLRPNDVIATRAAFFLDSESQIRSALQDYEAPPPVGAPTATDSSDLDVTVQLTPDPPRTGDNIIEVRVRSTDGRPVTNARVEVRLAMPAMPSMNMPAMRSAARLDHVGEGVYRGSAAISLRGRWDLTVTARGDNQTIGSTLATVLVR
jgi:hypothetical protein